MGFDGNIAERFWVGALSSFAASKASSALRPLRYTRPSGTRVSVRVELPRAVADSLEGATKGHGVAELVLLTTAVRGVLYRYSGDDRVVVGLPGFPGAERSSILFLLPRVGPGRSFREEVATVKETVLEVSRYRPYSLDVVCDRLSQEQTDVRGMFDVAVTSAVFGEASPELDRFALQVTLSPPGQDRGLELVSRDGWVESRTLEGLGRHALRFLGKAFATPEVSMGDLAILSPAQRHQVVEELNDTATPRDGDGIVRLFAERARQEGRRVAVVHGGRELTYAELDARSSQLGRLLLSSGVEPEDRVVVLMRKCVELPVCLWGILKAGGVYVPVDVDLPGERILSITERCAARCVIADQDGLRQAPLRELSGAGREVLLAGDLEYLSGEHDATDLDESVSSRGLAYVLYTSGTSGAPKGVMVERRSLANLGKWYATRFAVTSRTRVLQLTPSSFDPSIEQVAGTLLAGGQVCLVEHLTPEPEILDTIARWRAEVLNATPSVLSSLLAHADSGGCLRQVISGGDVLPESLKQRLLERGYQVHNNYGPTELTVDATSSRCRPLAPVTIGSPVDNNAAYVLNSRLEPLPAGVGGRLWLSGLGLARGYFGEPALTAAAFVPNPFGRGARMFDSGDTARWTAAGDLDFLARDEAFVKIRGARVSLAEVEQALASDPGVDACAVVVVRDERGADQLCAFVEAPEASEESLRDGLLERLPRIMMPARIVELVPLPRLATGKLDRRKLRELASVAASGEELREPETETEIELAAIWSGVLEIDRVGVNVDFFVLGGDSLKATRVIYELFQAFGVDVNLPEFFKVRTVEKLAALVEDKLLLTATAEDYRAVTGGTEDELG